jgi:prolyl-tRNA editing enzyme YbaK/EbsC (Cys-tRNA(Pro) deacylase)
MTDLESEPIEARVRETLDGTGVPYELIPVEPELADTAAFCEHYGYAPSESGNCIVVASKKPPGQYAACVVLATTKLDVNQTVKRRMGVARVSFATAEETRDLTGMMIGGVTPFGLPETMPLWVDDRVMKLPRVILGGGSRSLKVSVPPRVFSELPHRLEVVEGLGKEAS